MKETEKEKNKYATIVAILFLLAIALFGFMRSCWNDVTNDLENREKERLTRQFTNALTCEQREQIIQQVIRLNGEIVVNNVIIDAPQPYYALENTQIDASLLALTIVPFQPIAEKLGYEIVLISATPLRGSEIITPILNVSIDNASFDIGNTEVRIDENSAFELLVAPYIDDDGMIFIPLTFFRDALGKTVYIFEGQVVIETYSDMR